MAQLIANAITIARAKRLLYQPLSISLKPGEIWGILGINGCGKTTLLQTLAGLHPIQSGDIYLDNQLLTHLNRKFIAKHIGLLLQDTVITFPQSVWDYCINARFPHLTWQTNFQHSRDKVTHALTAMDLITQQHACMTALSGGEKRRAALAALLTQAPDIYLLDEPTNHIDIRYQQRILNYFQQLTKTTAATIMLATHDVNIVQHYCTHVLLLFSDGTHLQGQTTDILTAAHLSALYQHPMYAIAHHGKYHWQAATN
jgi:iron complex transport system ATP-binding protein